ncbi:hypothetical protein [Campylobacter hyointestinalis]|uniref:hypothetical protein n=1 Tax=Campylobacter hyointestinalis TaxID=198 RepID=UPI000DCE4728|nr:hypothetical protein [Campylobacter hyointestinalis]RAZ45748.1 hypothetical protein CHL14416_07465 [Campylobacter hyointestinalis subsp. lawsonii]
MKLNELQMHPAPVSDAIFLGKIKSNKWVEKIDFTEQFYECLAELCLKELNKRNTDSLTLTEQFESGLVIEIKAYTK